MRIFYQMCVVQMMDSNLSSTHPNKKFLVVGEVGKTGVVAARPVVGDSRLEGDHVTIPLQQMVEISARVTKRNKGSAIKNLVPLMEFGDLGVIGEIVLKDVE